MKNVYYLTELTKHYSKENNIHWYSAVYSNGLNLIDKEYSVGESIATIIFI
jgi:hypothetical protein